MLAGIFNVADRFNNTVRKVSPSGTVSTIGGRENALGYRNGVASVALFSNPKGIAVSPTGLLYVSEFGSDRIRIGRPISNRARNAPATIATMDTDSDGDGMTDFNELLAGTDPYDSTSVLGFLSVTETTGAEGQKHIGNFPAVAGRIYRIEYSPDGTPGTWTSTVDQLTPKSGANILSVNLELPQDSLGFVRIVAYVGDGSDSATSAPFAFGGDSVLVLLDARWTADRQNIVLTWMGTKGTAYHIERSDDLVTWFKILESDAIATGLTEESVVNSGSETGFFRVTESGK